MAEEDFGSIRDSFRNQLVKDRSEAFTDYFEAILGCDFRFINIGKNRINSVESALIHLDTTEDAQLIDEIEELRQSNRVRDSYRNITGEDLFDDDDDDDDEEDDD